MNQVAVPWTSGIRCLWHWCGDLPGYYRRWDLLPLSGVWSGTHRYVTSLDAPGKTGVRLGLPGKVFFSLLLAGRAFTLYHLVVRAKGRTRSPAEYYVTAWIVAVFFMLALPVPEYEAWKWFLLALLPGWRVLDIMTFHMCAVMFNSPVRSLRRTFVFAILNLIEIVTAYAVCYRYVGGVVSPPGQYPQGLTPVSAWYFSVVTATTVGYGDFRPESDFTRLIVILELLTAVVFTLTVLPAIVQGLGIRESGGGTGSGKGC
jgi:hypothetical protein